MPSKTEYRRKPKPKWSASDGGLILLAIIILIGVVATLWLKSRAHSR